MAQPFTGVVHGNTVVLDRSLPPLDGHRVRVVLEDIDLGDASLSSEDHGRLWAERAQSPGRTLA